MSKVPVYDGERVIARVNYNSNLDFWDGRNMTSGSTGRHLGYTRLKSGAWVLIYGTQWQGERDHAEVVSQDELIQAAARTGHLSEVYDRYPELRGSLPEEEMDVPEPQALWGEVTTFGNGAHVIVPKDLIGKRIRYQVED